MSVQTSVRLPNQTYKHLKTLATRTGRPATFYIREALEAYLEEVEDIELAEQALTRIRNGEERTYTLTEVEQELGLAD